MMMSAINPDRAKMPNTINPNNSSLSILSFFYRFPKFELLAFLGKVSCVLECEGTPESIFLPELAVPASVVFFRRRIGAGSWCWSLLFAHLASSSKK